MTLMSDLHKYAKLTDERAMLDAIANGTYIVYVNKQDEITGSNNPYTSIKQESCRVLEV